MSWTEWVLFYPSLSRVLARTKFNQTNNDSKTRCCARNEAWTSRASSLLHSWHSMSKRRDGRHALFSAILVNLKPQCGVCLGGRGCHLLKWHTPGNGVLDAPSAISSLLCKAWLTLAIVTKKKRMSSRRIETYCLFALLSSRSVMR